MVISKHFPFFYRLTPFGNDLNGAFKWRRPCRGFALKRKNWLKGTVSYACLFFFSIWIMTMKRFTIFMYFTGFCQLVCEKLLKIHLVARYCFALAYGLFNSLWPFREVIKEKYGASHKCSRSRSFLSLVTLSFVVDLQADGWGMLSDTIGQGVTLVGQKTWITHRLPSSLPCPFISLPSVYWKRLASLVSEHLRRIFFSSNLSLGTQSPTSKWTWWELLSEFCSTCLTRSGWTINDKNEHCETFSSAAKRNGVVSNGPLRCHNKHTSTKKERSTIKKNFTGSEPVIEWLPTRHSCFEPGL